MALRKIFWKNNVLIDHEDVGGNVNRTVRLNLQTGETFIKISGRGEIKV
jgi:chemotaxis protein CheD